jgi:hypothetical protein
MRYIYFKQLFHSNAEIININSFQFMVHHPLIPLPSIRFLSGFQQLHQDYAGIIPFFFFFFFFFFLGIGHWPVSDFKRIMSSHLYSRSFLIHDIITCGEERGYFTAGRPRGGHENKASPQVPHIG